MTMEQCIKNIHKSKFKDRYSTLILYKNIFLTNYVAPSTFAPNTYPAIKLWGSNLFTTNSPNPLTFYTLVNSTSVILAVPWIITLNVISGITTPTIFGFGVSNTLTTSSGTVVSSGFIAGNGWNDATLLGLPGELTNTNSAATTNNTQVAYGAFHIGTAFPSTVYFSLREYVAGTILYCCSDVNGNSITGWPVGWQTFGTNLWSNNSAPHYLMYFSGNNSIVNLQIISTPNSLYT